MNFNIERYGNQRELSNYFQDVIHKLNDYTIIIPEALANTLGILIVLLPSRIVMPFFYRLFQGIVSQCTIRSLFGVVLKWVNLHAW